MLNYTIRSRKRYMRIIFSIGSVFILSAGSIAHAIDPILSPADIEYREQKTLDLLSNIDAYNVNDERLRLDSAKAHYNMGNIYYHKGEYELSVREYYQAVILMPNDPDSHYNLAFVSGEHLNDYKTALKHYQMYLYLKPHAEDKYLVRRKIKVAKVSLRSIIDSPLMNKY